MELFYETKVGHFRIRHDKESSAHHFISTFKYSLLNFYSVPACIVIQYIYNLFLALSTCTQSLQFVTWRYNSFDSAKITANSNCAS